MVATPIILDISFCSCAQPTMCTTSLKEIVNITCTAGLSDAAVQTQLHMAHVGYVLRSSRY